MTYLRDMGKKITDLAAYVCTINTFRWPYWILYLKMELVFDKK